MAWPIRRSCIFCDDDEDCQKCAIHGIIYTCAGCKDFRHLAKEVEYSERKDGFNWQEQPQQQFYGC